MKSVRLAKTGHRHLLGVPGSRKCAVKGCGNRAVQAVLVVTARKRHADGEGGAGKPAGLCKEHKYLGK